MKFEEWYEGVYLPEQIIDTTPREKSGLRFAFEEGRHCATEAAKPRWIPVTERKPKREGSYPVKIESPLSSFQKGYFESGKFDKVYFDRRYWEPTHWLELPE